MVKLGESFKKHKVLVAIFSIILILIIVLIFCTVADPVYDKNNPLTKEQISELLQKGRNYPNYHFMISEKTGAILNSKEDPIESIEYYIKDNLILQKINRKDNITTINWEDTDTGEIIYTSYSAKRIIIGNSKMEGNLFGISGIARQNIINFDYYTEYKYLGRTKLNNRDTVVVKVGRQDTYPTIYYIDEQSGIIVKQVYKQIFLNYTEYKQIEFDTVTDEQVKKPDLKTEYPDYEIMNMYQYQ